MYLNARIKLRNKKRSRQPKRRATLPAYAERRYVGFSVSVASRLHTAVLEAIRSSNELQAKILAEKLYGTRKDSDNASYFMKVAGVGSRILSNLRFRFGTVEDEIQIDAIGEDVFRHVQKQAKRVLGIAAEDITGRHNIESWRRENIALIKRMTDEELSKIASIIDQTSTDTVDSVASELLNEFEMTGNRARMIAVDQTLKFNAQLTQEIHKQAGISEYYWADVEDDAVREMHHKLGEASRNGKRFRYDDPPVSEKNGEANNPGEGVHCRCQAIPYIPEYDEP